MMRPNRADKCRTCYGRRRVVACATGEAELAGCQFPGLPILELPHRPLGGAAVVPCPGECGTAAAIRAEHRVGTPA